MKDPVGVFGLRRGFSFQGRRRPHQIFTVRRRAREPIATSRICSRKRGALMPPWLEVLLNVAGFTGFIGIAKYHKPRSEKLPDR